MSKEIEIPKPVKHDIKNFLFCGSVLFKNGRGLLIHVDAVDLSEAENAVNALIAKNRSSDKVVNIFTVPVVHLEKGIHVFSA